MRLFVLYVVVEMAVIVALTATIGFGWTVLALIAAFLLGLALAGSQLRRQIVALQQRMRDPGAQLTDSALVGLGSVLVVVPGLVTSLAGVLMLAPPTRSLMRPLAGAVAARAISRSVVFVPARPGYGAGEVIDGEVVDVQDGPKPSGPAGPAIAPKPD
ncbi:FxsA family protein [Mycobacterium sp. ACS4331]|uniref:FxsA family protein n=1 Tax=Mycobacterium sp. ACS4331 TaxID=1834121 RepID=UPI00336A4AF2